MNRQKGFTLIELALASAIMAVASIAAGLAMYQVVGGTEDNNNRITAVHQVQNAGYWISRDAQMAVTVNTTDNLTFPNFLQIGWTEWDDEGTPVYHLAEYTLENGSDNLYSLKRNHTSSIGASDEMMVADYLYYQPGTDYTSNTTYTNPMLTINLTAVFDEFRESREYKIKRRAGL